ncbi:MAG: hypothetical protein AAGE99_05640 [Chlamydiota bacterium]
MSVSINSSIGKNCVGCSGSIGKKKAKNATSMACGHRIHNSCLDILKNKNKGQGFCPECEQGKRVDAKIDGLSGDSKIDSFFKGLLANGKEYVSQISGKDKKLKKLLENSLDSIERGGGNIKAKKVSSVFDCKIDREGNVPPSEKPGIDGLSGGVESGSFFEGFLANGKEYVSQLKDKKLKKLLENNLELVEHNVDKMKESVREGDNIKAKDRSSVVDCEIDRGGNVPSSEKGGDELKKFKGRVAIIENVLADISGQLKLDRELDEILDKSLNYINRQPIGRLPDRLLGQVTKEIVGEMFGEANNDRERLKELPIGDLFEKLDRIIREKVEKLEPKNEKGEKPVGYDRPLSSVSTVSRKPSAVESQEIFNREIIKSGEGFRPPIEIKKTSVRKTEYVLNMDEDLIKTLGRCHDYINRQPIDRLPKESFVRVTEEITEKILGVNDNEQLKKLSDKDLFEKLDRIIREKTEKLERKNEKGKKKPVGYEGDESKKRPKRLSKGKMIGYALVLFGLVLVPFIWSWKHVFRGRLPYLLKRIKYSGLR